jgi:hypothetical protein
LELHQALHPSLDESDLVLVIQLRNWAPTLSCFPLMVVHKVGR